MYFGILRVLNDDEVEAGKVSERIHTIQLADGLLFLHDKLESSERFFVDSSSGISGN